MAALLVGAGWSVLVGWLLARLLRQAAAYRGTALGPAERMSLPPVSVIVPARNEEANIGPCLARLAAQNGWSAGGEIIVVDDDSVDATPQVIAAIAAAEPRLRPLAAGPLPPGWVGKPHACWRGAQAATGDWLCFVDADVQAEPDLLATAIATARRRDIALLSLHPRQVLGSFWERLIIPAGLLIIGCAADLRRVNDPAAGEVTANGQFLLIRRNVYFALGGHAAVRDQICEDRALAALVKRSGRRFRLLGAEHLAQVRMYRDLGTLWEGLSKNATEILGSDAKTLAAASLAFLIDWTALILPPALATVSGAAGTAALAGSLVLAGVHIGTARHFRVPWPFGLMFPLAGTTVAVLACRSVGLRRHGRVRWKGRSYPAPQQPAVPRPR